MMGSGYKSDIWEESLNSEHNTEMTQGSIQRIDRLTTRLICHVGDMIRFPRYNGQEEE